MSIELHMGDLPAGVSFGKSVAVDTETMGLNPYRDRLCLVQLSDGGGTSHLVKFEKDQYDAPNLEKVLTDPSVTKIFHFARFDIAILKMQLDIVCTPVYCTKVASKLVRTFTDKHGLKQLCHDLLKVDLKKQQQSSYWGADVLTKEQMAYAASDVLYLHRLRAILDEMLAREGRMALAQSCFDFLPTRVELDLDGWQDAEIFAH